LQTDKQNADTKLLTAQGKLALDQAKIDMDKARTMREGLAGAQGPTDVERMELAIKNKLADAKVMDTKFKGVELGADMHSAVMKTKMEEEALLAKERIQMVDLAQNIAVHPESEQVVRNLLGNVIPSITRQ